MSSLLRRACPGAALSAAWLLAAIATASPAVGLAAASAASPAGQPSLTLRDALDRAERQHPMLRAAAAQVSAASARADVSRLRPLPELSVEVENVLGSGEWRGVSGAETTLALRRTVEPGALRRARLDQALADRDGSLGDEAIAHLDLRAEVARRFVHLLSDQARLSLTDEAVTQAAGTLREVERRIEAGRAPLAERARARVALERARLAQEHAEHALLAARHHLAAAMGDEMPDFGDADGELLDLPEVAAFDTLMARLRESPDQLRFADENRLREVEQRLAAARARPGLTLGAGIRHSEAGGDTGLVFSASVPLFASRQAGGAVVEAGARRDRSAAQARAAFLRAQAQLFELYQELRHARIEFEAQRDRIIPDIDEALADTRRLYASGRYTLMELRDAQAEWIAHRQRLIAIATEYHRHLIDIQRLTGAPASIAGSSGEQP